MILAPLPGRDAILAPGLVFADPWSTLAPFLPHIVVITNLAMQGANDPVVAHLMGTAHPHAAHLIFFTIFSISHLTMCSARYQTALDNTGVFFGAYP